MTLIVIEELLIMVVIKVFIKMEKKSLLHPGSLMSLFPVTFKVLVWVIWLGNINYFSVEKSKIHNPVFLKDRVIHKKPIILTIL